MKKVKLLTYVPDFLEKILKEGAKEKGIPVAQSIEREVLASCLIKSALHLIMERHNPSGLSPKDKEEIGNFITLASRYMESIDPVMSRGISEMLGVLSGKIEKLHRAVGSS